MLGLALRYYDLAKGNTNLLSFNERTCRISAGKQIEEYLLQGGYYDDKETASFYVRHMPKQALRSTDPVHDYFTALLPGVGYRGGNGHLMCQTRLSALSRIGIVWSVFSLTPAAICGFSTPYPVCRSFFIPTRRVQRQKPTLIFAGFPGCFTRMARVLDWRYETGRTRSAM